MYQLYRSLCYKIIFTAEHFDVGVVDAVLLRRRATVAEPLDFVCEFTGLHILQLMVLVLVV